MPLVTEYFTDDWNERSKSQSHIRTQQLLMHVQTCPVNHTWSIDKLAQSSL